MIITQERSNCCNAPVIVCMPGERPFNWLCSRCNNACSVLQVRPYEFPELEISDGIKVYWYKDSDGSLMEAKYVAERLKVADLETRIAELENEVSILRASKV